MPADALNLLYLTRELNGLLKNGRIDKITMPKGDTITLTVYAGGKNHCLVISVNPSCPRCHITKSAFENPLTAPSFLMHLRKNIGSGRIEKIELTPYERIINIHIAARNELLMQENKILVVELMGKYSNIILVNSENKITESLRHISPDVSSKRVVLPGLAYSSAPAQGKVDCSDETALTCLLDTFEGVEIDGFIASRVSGLSKTSISEAVFTAFEDNKSDFLNVNNKTKIAKKLFEIHNEKNMNPCLAFKDGKAVDYYFRPYSSIKENEYKLFDFFSLAIDEFYSQTTLDSNLNQKLNRLHQIIKNATAKAEKRLAQLVNKADECADFERDRLYGELITANLYKIQKGAKSVSLENYYDENYAVVNIPLDENISPQLNAQRYFRRYDKKKKTLENNQIQTKKFKDELEYLDSVALSLQLYKNSSSDLDEIKDELIESGYIDNEKIKGKGKNKKPEKMSKALAHLKYSYNGYNIYCGKNNLQNEHLTKSAKPFDLWLHAKDIHGAHVLIENKSKDFPPDDILLRAAALAAFNSKARLSGKVPVDYTFAKFVSKPAGALPGKVNYTNYYTVNVTPMDMNE